MSWDILKVGLLTYFSVSLPLVKAKNLCSFFGITGSSKSIIQSKNEWLQWNREYDCFPTAAASVRFLYPVPTRHQHPLPLPPERWDTIP